MSESIDPAAEQQAAMEATQAEIQATQRGRRRLALLTTLAVGGSGAAALAVGAQTAPDCEIFVCPTDSVPVPTMAPDAEPVPGDPIPGDPIPIVSVFDTKGTDPPESTVPESTVPESTVPESTVPESTVPPTTVTVVTSVPPTLPPITIEVVPTIPQETN